MRLHVRERDWRAAPFGLLSHDPAQPPVNTGAGPQRLIDPDYNEVWPPPDGVWRQVWPFARLAHWVSPSAGELNPRWEVRKPTNMIPISRRRINQLGGTWRTHDK